MALEVIEGAFRQEHSSTLEVDTFMENCAKRWQRSESTYQLKCRRLLDVRDASGYQGADIDMTAALQKKKNQPHSEKRQETNFQNANSKASAHTHVSLSSQRRKFILSSSRKCLSKLHANMFLPFTVLLNRLFPAIDVCLQSTFSCSLPNQPADDDTKMTDPTIEGEITCSFEVETALNVSSTLLIILSSLLMRNIALLSLSFLSPISSHLSRSIFALISLFWNAILLRTYSLVVVVLFLSMSQRTPFWMRSEAVVYRIFDLHYAACTSSPLSSHLHLLASSMLTLIMSQ